MSPTSYPAGLDTTARFPTDVTNDTDSQAGTPRTGLKGFLAQWVDDVSDALVKIEAELGIQPRGAYTDVSTRLETMMPKATVIAASTANITISPGGVSLVVDGVTVANGDQLLLKDQTLPAQNGVYTVGNVGTSVTLTRSSAFDSAAELAGLTVSVIGGTIYGDSIWTMVTNPPITVGTTALRWTRTYPAYPPYIRDFWQVGSTPPLAANMDRMAIDSSVTQTVITAMSSFHGGMILRAGTTYTNVNSFCTATGSGAVTLNHYSIVRQSDRVTLMSTANSVALPALGEYPRALTSPLTVDVDTPVWVLWSTQVATTAPSFAGLAALTALVQPLAVRPPITQGNTSTVPTSTPPVPPAVIAAPTTATSPLVYFWLT